MAGGLEAFAELVDDDPDPGQLAAHALLHLDHREGRRGGVRRRRGDGRGGLETIGRHDRSPYAIGVVGSRRAGATESRPGAPLP
ncbi:hypothetical protein GCM10027215_15400 [Nocardioides zeae]